MINVVRIRQQVQKAIDALPSEINLKRVKKVPDGYGGYTEGVPDGYGGFIRGEDVAIFNGFIDFASNKPQININMNDAGSVFSVKNITLLAAYDPSFLILKDDYFTYKDIQYKIRHSINQFDIYWQCELEVV